MTATISVVIPTYNRGRLALRAALSALLQSKPPDEVIVVDDGSTDDTETLVAALIAVGADFGIATGSLRYLRLPENRGANAARNAGIAACTSERTAFLDSDDFWHPRKLAMQSAAISAEKAHGGQPVFSYTGRFRVDEQLAVVARQFGPLRSRARLRRSNFIGSLSSVVIDRAVLSAIGGFDESLHACQDWDMYLRALPHCRAVQVPEPLLLYHDATADRITLNHRKRVIAHVQLYRRHLRGRLRRRSDLAELYRNIAEDLSELGRRRAATHFYAAHLAAGRHPIAARLTAMATWRKVKARRYEGYAEARRAEAADAGRAAESAACYDECIRFAERCTATVGKLASAAVQQAAI